MFPTGAAGITSFGWERPLLVKRHVERSVLLRTLPAPGGLSRVRKSAAELRSVSCKSKDAVFNDTPAGVLANRP